MRTTHGMPGAGHGVRRRTLGWRAALAGATALAAIAIAVCGGGAASAASKCSNTSSLTNYVGYTCGHAGQANSKLSPVLIGWVNNQGGKIPPVGASTTSAAQFAVDYVNKYLGGVDGHPVKLETCFVKNSEQEGLGCAQKFLGDKAVNAIAYGAVSVGATTISSTVKGKKPIIMAYSLNPPDLSAKANYILFGAGNYTVYGFGAFAKNYLHAKTAAVLYPQGPGLSDEGGAVKDAMEAAGIQTKSVGFDPNSTDLTGALTAAGAQTADAIAPIIATHTSCLAFERALKTLNISESKVVGFLQCTDPALKKSYGGDFPKWYYGQAQSGDALTNPVNARGAAFKKALARFKLSDKVTDPWYPVTFSEILTIVQWMNSVGADKLTPQAIDAKAKGFRGPLLLGPSVVRCGKYPKAPGNCGDGDSFFKYEGNGQWKQVVKWLEPPAALQKKLGAKHIDK
jgi:branched-chain amino acid transport system substrate-binding protein